MRLTNSVFLNAINPEEEWCLGIYHDKVLTVDIEPGEDIPADEIKYTLQDRIIIGFLLFNIQFLYNG